MVATAAGPWGPAPTDLESKDSAESYAIRVSNLIFGRFRV